MNKKFFKLMAAAAATLCLAGSAAGDTESRFEELARRYGSRAESAAAAAELRIRLER